MRTRIAVTAAVAAIGLVVAGCGGTSSGGRRATGSSQSTSNASTPSSSEPSTVTSAPEVNPAGDIPDNQAFVTYTPASGGFSVKVPEGWARTTSGGAVTFTDKLNSIRIESRAAAKAPTVDTARANELPALANGVPGYKAGDVSSVTRTAGPAIRITYLGDSPADPVTGKSHVNAVERYLFFHNGREAVLTLSGPQGADNVDPWKIVTGSLRWAA